MSKVYIHNGEDWCNICSGKAKIRVPSEEWVQVDPLTKETKIFNGEEWVPLDCCYACDVDTPLPRPTFQGDNLHIYTGKTTPIVFTSMDFMDDISLIPTCEELKNIGCPVDGETYDDLSTTYRENRDDFLKDSKNNWFTEYYMGTTPMVLDYSTWAPGGLADKIVYPTHGNLQEYNILMGCPECTFQAWEGEPSAELPSLTEIMTYLPAIEDGTDPLPETGNPGEIVGRGVIESPGSYDWYMWSELQNQWILILLDIEDIQTTNGARVNAWLKAFNELILANSPFIWANDYLPFHRWKAEEI